MRGTAVTSWVPGLWGSKSKVASVSLGPWWWRCLHGATLSALVLSVERKAVIWSVGSEERKDRSLPEPPAPSFQHVLLPHSSVLPSLTLHLSDTELLQVPHTCQPCHISVPFFCSSSCPGPSYLLLDNSFKPQPQGQFLGIHPRKVLCLSSVPCSCVTARQPTC